MGQNCQPSTKKRFGHCIYNMAMGYLALHLSWAALNWKSMFLFQFSIFIFIFVHKNIIIGSLPKWILLGFSFGFMACILFIGHETKWTPQWKSKWKLVLAINMLYIFFWTKTEHEKNFAQLEAARFSCLVNPALNAETGLISYPNFTNRANSKGTQPTIGTESTLTEVGRFFGPNYKYRTDMTCWLNSTWYPIWIL